MQAATADAAKAAEENAAEMTQLRTACEGYKTELDKATQRERQLEQGVEQALAAVDAKYIDMLQEKQVLRAQLYI